MSYPPPPPSGPHAPGPAQGWGPPSGPPPGPYGAPPGPYGQGPRKRRTGLIVAVVAFVVLLTCGIAVTALLLLNGDDEDRRADPSRSESTSEAPSPSTSDPTEPTEPSDPSDTPSSTGPVTPYVPSDDTGDDIHLDVEAAEFPGDWNFKFGDVEHFAGYLDSWDYDTCGPVEEGSVLTQQRCEYAAQWAFTALKGKVRLTQIFLVFDTEPHAKAAEAALSDTDLDLRAETVADNYVQGSWNSSSHGNVVSVTVGTATTKVSEDKLRSLVNYMNTDFRVALTFK